MVYLLLGDFSGVLYPLLALERETRLSGNLSIDAVSLFWTSSLTYVIWNEFVPIYFLLRSVVELAIDTSGSLDNIPFFYNVFARP